jgi:hypothetical protein
VPQLPPVLLATDAHWNFMNFAQMLHHVDLRAGLSDFSIMAYVDSPKQTVYPGGVVYSAWTNR